MGVLRRCHGAVEISNGGEEHGEGTKGAQAEHSGIFSVEILSVYSASVLLILAPLLYNSL
jgi:hypothetical protein